MPDNDMILTTEPKLQIKVYAIKKEKKPDFVQNFCEKTIKPWLDPWVDHCSAWLAENDDSLWLIVAVTPHPDHPWEGKPASPGHSATPGIDKLAEYLKSTPAIEEVKALTIG